jgi:hypothetical protein
MFQQWNTLKPFLTIHYFKLTFPLFHLGPLILKKDNCAIHHCRVSFKSCH